MHYQDKAAGAVTKGGEGSWEFVGRSGIVMEESEDEFDGCNGDDDDCYSAQDNGRVSSPRRQSIERRTRQVLNEYGMILVGVVGRVDE